MAKQFMTHKQFAASEGISRQMVDRWIKAGLPVISDGRIPVTEARAWLKANVIRRVPGGAGEALTNARTRREGALASLRELELAKRRGELMERTDVERVWGQIITGVRSRMLGVADAVAARVAASSDVLECREIVNNEICAGLTALSEYPGGYHNAVANKGVTLCSETLRP